MEYQKTNKARCALLSILALGLSLLIHAQTIEWRPIAPGIWSAQIGRPQPVTLLSAAAGTPRMDALRSLGEHPFPLPKEEIHAELRHGRIYLRLPLQKTERLYGLGLNFRSINQRGHVLDLHVDHYGGIDNGRTHAPVPFYISDKGYGVLINSAQYITVYAGTGVRVDTKNPPKTHDRNTDPDWQPQPYSDAVEVLVPADGVELIVFAGRTPLEVVQRYNLFNGGGVLPPKWGLGFTQRMPTLSTEQDVRKEVENFSQHQFPLDFIGLEPGWQSASYP